MRRLISLAVMLLISGTITFAQVGINSDNSIPNGSAMLDVKSSNKGLLPPRMTKSNRNSIATPAAGLIVFQTDSIPGYYFYTGTSWTAFRPSHSVGEFYGGGIVFFTDNTGEHGLIASLDDMGTVLQWGPAPLITGAINTWNGQLNTTTILSVSPAAQLCDTYVNAAAYNTGVFSDWYMPAIDQLSLIYHSRYTLNKNMDGIPGINPVANQGYWSSTESNGDFAWFFDFRTGAVNSATKDASKWVRAIRAF